MHKVYSWAFWLEIAGDGHYFGRHFHSQIIVWHCYLHLHHLGHVAFDADLSAKERLHSGLRIALEEYVASGCVVGGHREVGRF